MIGFTPREFSQVREAIAAAHMFAQAFAPLLKQRHTTLNRDQRQLLTVAPGAIAEGFATVAAVTHRENRDPDAVEPKEAIKLTEIDTVAMRDELENVSALVLPDIAHEFACVLKELPMYDTAFTADEPEGERTARIMAWTWEAGRRYGMQQGIAVTEACLTEFATNLQAILVTALNATLDLPTPELPSTTATITPLKYPPADTDENGDARSMGAAPGPTP